MTIVVGVDNSDHSFYALRWTLRHYFAGAAAVGAANRLVIVYAKPNPSSAISIGGLGSVDIKPYLDSDLTRIATTVIAKARELCAANSMCDVVYEVMEGDARIALCDAAEIFHADLLVLGSQGYGAIKRAVLGSVSDYCTHHSNCNVMIVKQPKHMN
ncbi:Universal stress protein A-like protein [Apostasia shenzhenica]|uniref:Universal stress protein A-like protein n=1 Tax=Apostasia shenzhenica TaxID=1088818 RepID=A0A2I0AH67_9ASPA|nr:Universal stress protein A-like protein [Apostasia shenzhenica]